MWNQYRFRSSLLSRHPARDRCFPGSCSQIPYRINPFYHSCRLLRRLFIHVFEEHVSLQAVTLCEVCSTYAADIFTKFEMHLPVMFLHSVTSCKSLMTNRAGPGLRVNVILKEQTKYLHISPNQSQNSLLISWWNIEFPRINGQHNENQMN